MPQLPKLSKRELPLLFILFLAVLLRLPGLTDSFWLDEAAQALEVSRPFSEQLQISADFQPPLLHLWLHLAQYVSHSEWWLRSMGALLPGVLTVWLCILLGKELMSRRWALVTGMLLASSSFHVFFSQELRPYSWSVFFALLSSLWLWRFLSKKESSWEQLLLAAGASFLGVMTSYVYAFFIAGQLVLLTLKRRFAASVLFVSTIGVASLPWLPFLWKQFSVATQLRSQLPGWSEVVGFSPLKGLVLTPAKFLFGVIDLSLNLPILVSVALLSFVLLSALNSRDWLRLLKEAEWQFLLVLGLTPTLLITMAAIFMPIFQPKRVIFLLPLFLLALVKLTSLMRAPRSQVLFLLLLASIQLSSLLLYYQNDQYRREDWRGLMQVLQLQFSPQQTSVVFSFSHPFAPWQWYAEQVGDNNTELSLRFSEYQLLSNQEYVLRSREQADELLKTVDENREYLLLFDYLRDLTDPNDYWPQAIRAAGYREIGVIDGYRLGFVRAYQKETALGHLGPQTNRLKDSLRESSKQ